ncbi:MAG: V4R domain-containing protein [Candidatus Heimdallarchaeaceae archaeon]
MSERVDLRNRINVMLFHFDQRLGPRLLFNVAEIQDARITASLTRLMDFNFLTEMKAFVNAMANVVYSSMFFSIPNPLARGGIEQFMISLVIFDPTITEYLMISSLEEEMIKTISKLVELSEMFIIITYANPILEDFPEIANCLESLRDNTIGVFQELFYGQFEGRKDAISQILGKIGKEAGKKLVGQYSEKETHSSRAYLDTILSSPVVSRWGKVNVLHFDPEEKVATVSVENSIWPESLGVIATKACAFTEGMLEAIFSQILKEPIICNEMRCAAEYSYVHNCIFQIMPGGVNHENISYMEDQTIREMGFKERKETVALIKEDIGEEIYEQLDPMIRLIQLFNKAPFISDFFFDETKFLIVCNYWRYPDEIICKTCEKWIKNTTSVSINLTKSKHRICEITYKTEEKKEKKD